MSQQVLFNGAVLVRPGAATKIDASAFANVVLSGIGTVALIGPADAGEPQTLQTFIDAQGVKDFYRSGPLVEAAQMVADPGNDPLIPAGASAIVCYKTNNSTKASLIHDTEITYTSQQWGLNANSTQVEVTSSGADLRIISITALDSNGNLITETSPEFGATADYGKFSIIYIGLDAGATTMTISATQLTTTTSATPADDLVINFADYNNLAEIIFYINGIAEYTCTSLITNDASFAPNTLDGITAENIDVLYTVMAHNFDLVDWIMTNSVLVDAVHTLGATGPRAVLAKTALTGGGLGLTTNANFTTGLTTLGGIRANQVVALVSVDGVSPDTYTISSVLVALESHCKLMSATAGKSERQGWGALDDTQANIIAQANTLNSEHLCLTGQQITRLGAVTGTLTVFEGWALACVLAGMRAGAPLGEPLTHKYIKASAITQDSGWENNVNGDVVDMLLNGVMTVAEIPGEGFRIEKGITTYTKSDNDAFTEETVVQGWKNISYEWRTALEKQYVGRPGDPGIVLTVKPFSISLLGKLRDQGAIADSIENGTVIDGFRDISVSLAGDVLSVQGTVSPTPGINFILNTAVIVPASISA